MNQAISQLVDELQVRFPEFFAVPGRADGKTPPRLEWFIGKLLEYDQKRQRYVEMYREKLADWSRKGRPPLPWEPTLYRKPRQWGEGDAQAWRDNISVATKRGDGKTISSFKLSLKELDHA